MLSKSSSFTFLKCLQLQNANFAANFPVKFPIDDKTEAKNGHAGVGTSNLELINLNENKTSFEPPSAPPSTFDNSAFGNPGYEALGGVATNVQVTSNVDEK